MLMDRTERRLVMVRSLGELLPLRQYNTEYGNTLCRVSKYKARLADTIELDITSDEVHAPRPRTDAAAPAHRRQSLRRPGASKARRSRALTGVRPAASGRLEVLALASAGGLGGDPRPRRVGCTGAPPQGWHEPIGPRPAPRHRLGGLPPLATASAPPRGLAPRRTSSAPPRRCRWALAARGPCRARCALRGGAHGTWHCGM
jgi:hypothetical protein